MVVIENLTLYGEKKEMKITLNALHKLKRIKYLLDAGYARIQDVNPRQLEAIEYALIDLSNLLKELEK